VGLGDSAPKEQRRKVLLFRSGARAGSAVRPAGPGGRRPARWRSRKAKWESASSAAFGSPRRPGSLPAPRSLPAPAARGAAAPAFQIFRAPAGPGRRPGPGRGNGGAGHGGGTDRRRRERVLRLVGQSGDRRRPSNPRGARRRARPAPDHPDPTRPGRAPPAGTVLWLVLVLVGTTSAHDRHPPAPAGTRRRQRPGQN
jgi:hypothetical protein